MDNPSDLVISPAGGGDWTVVEDLAWPLPTGETLVVPAGFITDLASVPWFLHWWLDPAGQPQVLAAVLHDWAYRVPKQRLRGTATRHQADNLFRQAMSDLGVGTVRRTLMFWAVRIGGRSSWKAL